MHTQLAQLKMKFLSSICLVCLIAVFLSFLGISFKNIAQESSGTVTDIDGNTYKTIQIGTQTWMAENLRTTKLNDGTPIPLVTNDAEWSNLSTPGYCWYENNINYKSHGAIYNWHTVNTGKLCPLGWHVPSTSEWKTLIDYLGGNKVAGGKLKKVDTTLWMSPNYGATNESRFSALPNGWRNSKGIFDDLGKNAGFWSSTQKGGIVWWMSVAYSQAAAFIMFGFNDGFGLTVRCLKD